MNNWDNRASFVSIIVVVLGGLLVSPVHGQEKFPSHRVGTIPAEELSSEVKKSAWDAVQGEDGTSTGSMAKIGLELAVLFHQHSVEGAVAVRDLRAQQTVPGTQKSGGRVDRSRAPRTPITSDGRYVLVDAVAKEDPEDLLEDLRGLGMKNGARAENLVSGLVPIEALDDAARLSTLRGMQPSYARRTAGSVESEADTSHAAFEARQNFDVDGTGQKVCALSDSYDNSSSASGSASEDIRSGDLPGAGNPEGNEAPVDVLDDEVEGSDEGRAMLQLIHDIVPGAELGFHTAFGGRADFASGIRELNASNCTVIVDDVGYFNQPFYQDGVITNAVDDVVDDGAAYFSSAGNDGQDSYEAPFRGSGMNGVLNASSERHDFDPSVLSDTEQQITVSDGGTVRISTFQWTDPSAAVSGSAGPDTDMDIALVAQDGTVLNSGEQNNISTGFPAETVISYQNTSGNTQTINLVIEKAAGPDPDQIKYIYSGRGFSIDEYDTLGPTIYGHPMAEGAMAVGAAAFFNTAAYNSDADPAVLNDFSSKGGIPILFDQDGNELGSPVVRQKPDVTGTDGTSTTFFGGDATGDGNPNFFGTSAAAPNVAATAALVLEASSFAPNGLYDRLESTSADVTRRLTRSEGLTVAGSSDGESTGPNGGRGADDWSGHGFVRPKAAIPPLRIAISSLDATVSQENTGEVTFTSDLQGENVPDVETLVIEKRYFGGNFVERQRVNRETKTTFTVTVGDLQVGRHQFRVTAETADGTALRTTRTSTVDIEAQRSEVSAFPNPFKEQLNVSFTLRREDVTVEVFDELGRRVAVRRPEEVSRNDPRPVQFNASELGSRSSGVFFVRVKTGGDFEETIQVVRVR